MCAQMHFATADDKKLCEILCCIANLSEKLKQGLSH